MSVIPIFENIMLITLVSAFVQINHLFLEHDIVHTHKKTLELDQPLYKTRNTVSNAHKMIPPSPPCFVWQSPCFALGNPKIMRIKI